MTTQGLAERLAEIEDSPQGTSLLELEDLLVAAGYRVAADDGDVVTYRNSGWGDEFYFNKDLANDLPVGIVLHVARKIRSHAQRRGLLR